MNGTVKAIRDWALLGIRGWDRFWFTPAEPHTLALVRILGGAMLFYTHLVWSLQLVEFLGPNAWIPRAASVELHRGTYAFSYLWYFDAPVLLWAQHLAALVVFALLALGCFTRVMSVLACLITLSYCHRLEGALFGLDQVNAMLSMYLMIGACGDVYSLDRWRRIRWAEAAGAVQPKISTNIAIRLIQLHMCIIYLFGGISKMRGNMWWDGSAVWYAVSNLEYQSLDMTWLCHYPWLLAILTHVTVFWETFYCFLVWPRFTRPIVLGLAICVHGGIALFLGMITFGLAMLIGNLAFVPPRLVHAAVTNLAPHRRTQRQPSPALRVSRCTPRPAC